LVAGAVAGDLLSFWIDGLSFVICSWSPLPGTAWSANVRRKISFCLSLVVHSGYPFGCVGLFCLFMSGLGWSCMTFFLEFADASGPFCCLFLPSRLFMARLPAGCMTINLGDSRWTLWPDPLSTGLLVHGRL